MKKILIIDGHPNESSFCHSVVNTYIEFAQKSGYDVQKIILRDLNFELNLKEGYQSIQELEPDLITAQEKISWCEHLVLIYPMWWGSMPALLKGFFDRCWLPGFAFKYHEKDPFWDKLLSGRSARMIVTSDAPYLYNLIAHFNAPYRVVKNMILKFCGFSPVRLSAFGSIKNLNDQKKAKIIQKISHLAQKGL